MQNTKSVPQAWGKLSKQVLAAAKALGLGALLLQASAGWAQIVTIPTISCQTDPAIFNTGINGSATGYNTNSPKYALNAGNVDDHWQYLYASTVDLTNANNYTQTGPNPNFTLPKNLTGTYLPAKVDRGGAAGERAWINSPFGNAEWLADANGVPRGYYVYRYQFNLDPGVTPSSFRVNLDYFSDDLIRRVYVNDTLIRDFVKPNDANIQGGGVTGAGGFGLNSRTNVALNQGWQPGLNTIYMVVSNQTGPVGFLTQAGGTAICTPDVFVTKNAYKDTGSSSPKGYIPPTPYNTPIDPNNPVYYSITVYNESLSSANGTVLTDVLPAGLDPAQSTWTCSVPNGGLATCPTPSSGNFSGSTTLTSQIGGTLPNGTAASGSLPPSSSLIYNIRSWPASGTNARPVITNTAKITPPPGVSCAAIDDYPTPCEESVTLSVGPVARVTKTVSPAGPLAPGDTAVFTVTVENPGSNTLTNVVINDPLPTEFASADWTCVSPPGSRSVCPNDSGSIAAGGSLNETEPTMPANSSLVYTINAKVKGIVGLTGSTSTNTVTVKPSNAGLKCMAADGSIADATSCSASAQIAVTPLLAEISKTVDTSKTYYAGDAVVYTITAINQSAVPLANVLVTDILPAGLVDNGGWTCVGCDPANPTATVTGANPLSTTIPSLAAGAQAVFTVNTKVDAITAATAITNDAQLSAANTATQCVKAGALVTPSSAPPCKASQTINALPIPLMTLSKTVSVTGTIFAGQSVDYTVTVTNTGTIPVLNATVTDVLPAGLVDNGGWSCTGCAAAAVTGPNALNYNIASLAPGASAVFTVKTKVAAQPPATITNNAQVTASDTHTLCGTSAAAGTAMPCKASQTIASSALPMIGVSKAVDVTAPVKPGDAVVFTVTVRNAGTVDASQVSISDPAPANIALGDWTCSGTGATCPAASGTGALTATVASLPVGSQLVFVIKAKVDAAAHAATPLTNTATATSAQAITQCAGGTALPCSASASVTTASATGTSPAPIPMDKAWALALLSMLLAAGAAWRLRARVMR